MVKSWAMGCLLALGALSTARAVCDDVDMFLDVPSPLNGDTTINLSVGVIQCELMDPRTNPEEITTIVVEGGTLTIASDNTVQFVNVAFTVMPGAALVFDMPETLFGPNDRNDDDFRTVDLMGVGEGGSLTFNGDVIIRDIGHAEVLLEVFGNAEFKKTVLIEDNSGGIFVRSGELRFRGDTTFRANDFVSLQNSDGGFVRFSTTATFDRSGSSDGGTGPGCVISNEGSTSKMSFRGDVYVINNSRCTNAEAPPVYNNGDMNFYGKARFNDNTSGTNGGAVRNQFGSMTFRRAVQFNNNVSERNGGGIAVDGGDVRFRKGVLFSGNTAQESGGAFAVLFGERIRNGMVDDSGFGSLTFEKPSVVRFRDNTVDTTRGDDIQSADCTVGEVEEGTTLIGFPDDDVCVAAT